MNIPHRVSLMKPGVAAAHTLKEMGIGAELRWVPTHEGVEENDLAHGAAKSGARGTSRNSATVTEVKTNSSRCWLCFEKRATD